MKRIISFVIAFAALISCLALASCAENSQKGPDGDLDRQMTSPVGSTTFPKKLPLRVRRLLL